jgi:hypothetical protein
MFFFKQKILLLYFFFLLPISDLVLVLAQFAEVRRRPLYFHR